ncbi:MAG TPA: HAD family phosphatase [Bacteroidales bacterium]|nr:HAD family phosphatase [Bacteroidales bacterium]
MIGTGKKSNMPAEFQTIIFDLDGVIINSEELHARAKRMTLNKYGIPYPETIFDDFKGRPDLDFWSYVMHELSDGTCSAAALDAYKRTVYFSISDELSLIPGVSEFIAITRKQFVRMGLVSSATLSDFSFAERKFAIRKWFDIIVLGEDTEQHKPHPEPYLKALSLLGPTPFPAVVIEDSPNGIRSAKAAGCHVFGITTSFTADELKTAGADRVVAGFPEIIYLLNGAHPAG